MIQVLIHHRIEDYTRWKGKFDQFRAARKAAGCLYERLSSAEHDPNDLFIFFEWDNAENARKFLGSSEIRQWLKDAGVMEQPRIQYYKEIDTQLLRESSQAA